MSDASPTGPGGNVFNKYESGNPIVRRLMRRFLADFDALVARADPTTAIEVGCGEGYLTERVAPRVSRMHAFDVDPETVAGAEARLSPLSLSSLTLAVGDILDPGPQDPADLVICSEVLEHVPDPERALRNLCQVSSRHLLLSVPREPIWRVLNVARGKYWRHLGNTPGHIQHWSGAAFAALVRRHAEIVEIRRPLPWTMLLARVR